MPAENLEIRAYLDKYKHQVLRVWEQSVLATHDFLTPTDFKEIREQVQSIDFNSLPVYCLTKDETVLGFIGVADRKIEMLFLDPKYFGQGLGRKLVNFATTQLQAEELDVNEQNVKAVAFYKKLGFEIFERREKDDQGRNYPLVRMKKND